MLFKAIEDHVGTINTFNPFLDSGQSITQAISVDARTDTFGAPLNSSLANKPLIQTPSVITTHSQEVKNAVKQIAEFIEQSDDPSAIALFDRFSQEFSKQHPEKFVLRQMWEGIERVLPSVNTLSESVPQIIYLINARTS
jgi:hypothetical protein